MDNLLIISKNDKSKELLCALIKEYSQFQIITTTSSQKARRFVANNEVAIAIIDTPLTDETGIDISIDFASNNIGTILIVKNDYVEQVSEKVEISGVLVVGKPIIKPLFYQAFKLQLSVRNKILGLRKENTKLRNKLEEIKIVDRAKWALIEQENYSENDAHKFIEQEAMNRRMTRGEISKEILEKYNL